MPTRKSALRPARRQGRRSSRRSRPAMPPGSTRVRYRELLRPVSAGTTMTLFCPGVTGLPHLDARAAMYEMYRLRGPLKIEYKTAAATTTPGEVLIGIDSDPQDATLTYAGTAALSPKAITQVWKSTTLVVPQGHAMKQKWLNTQTSIGNPVPVTPSTGVYEIANWPYDSVAFGIQVTSTGPTSGSTGSIWVEYDIELSSPKVLDVTSGISAVPYTTGSAREGAITLLGAGAAQCPVPEGQFWIGVTAGTNAEPSLDQSDLATGYRMTFKGLAGTIPLPPGYELHGAWSKAAFLCADRTPGSSSNWCNSTYTYHFPPLPSTINGNVLYVVASSLAGLIRLIGRKTA
nr:MAG: hypothetical protein 2 [Tombusviridae sp.]